MENQAFHFRGISFRSLALSLSLCNATSDVGESSHDWSHRVESTKPSLSVTPQHQDFPTLQDLSMDPQKPSKLPTMHLTTVLGQVAHSEILLDWVGVSYALITT
jgi:hypothetical protein